jgi:hypothetical protein
MHLKTVPLSLPSGTVKKNSLLPVIAWPAQHHAKAACSLSFAAEKWGYCNVITMSSGVKQL